MKYTILALSALSAVSALNSASLRRRLSYERVAGYLPGSLVTDHCAIDLDQRALEGQIGDGTNDSFAAAMKIYKEGGNSKSYALVTLTAPLSADVDKGTSIMGRTAAGVEVSGKAYSGYKAGDSVLKVQYVTTAIQADYVNCQVGGLAEDTNLEGCLIGNGVVNVGGTDYAYTYDPLTDNNNGRTISGFSTAAKEKMRDGCKGCPYKDFSYFYEYYGTDTYADEWVMAALNGEATSFSKGNADFSKYSFTGRGECAKKGTAYMNVFMYVIREFEDALDDCESTCILCNDDAVHAWDEGVCFYTGSLEGEKGTSDGKLLHQLADKRCKNYGTCGAEGTEKEGMAAVNYELFDLFALGNYQLQSGNCAAARETTKLVVDLMYIPLIQGSMRYAYKVDKLQGGEKEAAEGAVFAASVLPRIHAASADSAETIYDNMKVGAPSTSFARVKEAFEATYADLGINCADIGGLWNEGTSDYYPGFEPCVDASTSNVVKEEDTTLAIILGSVFGGLLLLVIFYVMFLRKREMDGKPVFAPATETKALMKQEQRVYRVRSLVKGTESWIGNSHGATNCDDCVYEDLLIDRDDEYPVSYSCPIPKDAGHLLQSSKTTVRFDYEVRLSGNIDSNIRAMEWSLLHYIARETGLSQKCNFELQYQNDDLTMKGGGTRRSLQKSLYFPTAIYSVHSDPPDVNGQQGTCSALDFDSDQGECFPITATMEVRFLGSPGDALLVQEYLKNLIKKQMVDDPMKLIVKDVTGLRYIGERITYHEAQASSTLQSRGIFYNFAIMTTIGTLLTLIFLGIILLVANMKKKESEADQGSKSSYPDLEFSSTGHTSPEITLSPLSIDTIQSDSPTSNLGCLSSNSQEINHTQQINLSQLTILSSTQDMAILQSPVTQSSPPAITQASSIDSNDRSIKSLESPSYSPVLELPPPKRKSQTLKVKRKKKKRSKSRPGLSSLNRDSINLLLTISESISDEEGDDECDSDINSGGEDSWDDNDEDIESASPVYGDSTNFSFNVHRKSSYRSPFPRLSPQQHVPPPDDPWA